MICIIIRKDFFSWSINTASYFVLLCTTDACPKIYCTRVLKSRARDRVSRDMDAKI